MLGAIIGDIVGSVYEWNNIKTKEFEITNPKAFFTDDTVLTVAVAQGFMNASLEDEKSIQDCIRDALLEYGLAYPHAGYGGRFNGWLRGENHQPYNSWGNGSAMRVSSAAYFACRLEEAILFARLSASVTHDHPEGLKGAEAVAGAVYLARQEGSKGEIRKFIEDGYYPLNFTLDEIRPFYEFDVSCQGTIPQAIIAFLEADSFEETIRNAISIGGDSDTLAAIAGGIAGAFYGVPYSLRDMAMDKLDDKLRHVVYMFEERFGEY